MPGGGSVSRTGHPRPGPRTSASQRPRAGGTRPGPVRTTPWSGWARHDPFRMHSRHDPGARRRAPARHKAQVADQLGHARDPGAATTSSGVPVWRSCPRSRTASRSAKACAAPARGRPARPAPRVRHLPADQVGEVAAQAGVQAGVGLVEEQRVAAGEQQAAERDPVRLAAGQPGRASSSSPPRPSSPAISAISGRCPPRARRTGSAAPTGAGTGRILAQQADPALPRRYLAARRGGPGQHPAVQHHGAPARVHQPGDGLEDRGLPGPGRAEQGEPLPRGHGERGRQPELPAVNLDVGLEHARSRCRRPAAAAARPPAGPGRTGAPWAALSPAGSSRSATVSRTGGRR